MALSDKERKRLGDTPHIDDPKEIAEPLRSALIEHTKKGRVRGKYFTLQWVVGDPQYKTIDLRGLDFEPRFFVIDKFLRTPQVEDELLHVNAAGIEELVGFYTTMGEYDGMNCTGQTSISFHPTTAPSGWATGAVISLTIAVLNQQDYVHKTARGLRGMPHAGFGQKDVPVAQHGELWVSLAHKRVNRMLIRQTFPTFSGSVSGQVALTTAGSNDFRVTDVAAWAYGATDTMVSIRDGIGGTNLWRLYVVRSQYVQSHFDVPLKCNSGILAIDATQGGGPVTWRMAIRGYEANNGLLNEVEMTNDW